jgi:hypothetical protein
MPETNGETWRERMDRFERGLAHLLENQARREENLHLHREGLVHRENRP